MSITLNICNTFAHPVSLQKKYSKCQCGLQYPQVICDDRLFNLLYSILNPRVKSKQRAKARAATAHFNTLLCRDTEQPVELVDQ